MFKIISENTPFEKKKLFLSMIFPCFLILLMFSVKLIESIEGLNLIFLGVKPLTVEGLPGVLLSPFIHSSWEHLFNNIVALFVLSVTLFYFYSEIAYKVFFSIYLLAGLMLWFGARPAWHVGASGWIYGLSAFLFVSGILRKHIPLQAISLFVVFLYGSIVWGMFPIAPNLPHSWEGHLWGFVAGVAMAFVYKKEGPQKPIVQEEEEDADDEDEYWKINEEI